MPKTIDTLTSRIIEYVRAHPGCSRSQIIDGIDFTGPPLQISNMLSRLRRQTTLRSEGPYPKLNRWYPIDGSTDPQYMAIAHDLLEELKDVNRGGRQAYLARRLEDLFDSH